MYTKFTLADIVQLRAKLYTQTTSEENAIEWLAAQLREYGNKSPCPQGKSLVHKLNGIEVCASFWRRVYALGESKHTAARHLVYSGNVLHVSGTNSKPTVKSDSQYNIAFSFWTYFFKHMCQTPHPGLRLFPHSMTYNVIFDEIYPRYMSRVADAVGGPAPPPMSKATFLRARWDPAFSDVKRRVKHRHCQCPTRLKLAEAGKVGFANEYDKAQYLARRNLHNRSVEAFRKLEIDLQQRAAHSPEEHFVLFYDDTSYARTLRTHTTLIRTLA